MNEMKTKLGHDPRLVKHLIPNFAVGCRRPTPGNGYLEALTQPNVRVVTDHIKKVVEEGIVLETGEIIKVDVFICATGFDISFFPRFPLIGRGGVSLADQWKDKPEGYLSLAVNNFPNYFSTWPSTVGVPSFDRHSDSLLPKQCSWARAPLPAMAPSCPSSNMRPNTWSM